LVGAGRKRKGNRKEKENRKQKNGSPVGAEELLGIGGEHAAPGQLRRGALLPRRRRRPQMLITDGHHPPTHPTLQFLE
jgi:hypothetical protein